MRLSEKRKRLLDREKQYLHLYNRYEDAMAVSFLTTLLHLILDVKFEEKRHDELKDMIDCIFSRDDVRNFLKANNLYEKILRLRIEI